ncbi:MAG: hypothetical protein QM723_18345 [Myxococcaceae bacterium]
MLEEIFSAGACEIRNLCDPSNWKVLVAVLSVHAAADAACIGFGIPPPRSDNLTEFDLVYVTVANHRLARDGSLSRFDPNLIRVLPKLRTPQVGISLRSLSHHLSTHHSEVDVKWLMQEGMVPERERTVNMLIYPAPFHLENTDFQPVAGPLQYLNHREFGFFKFEPRERLNSAHLESVLAQAQRQTGRVHGLVLPECAVHEDDLALLKRLAVKHRIGFVVAGLRKERANEAFTGVQYLGKWRESSQPKHHRWCLDGHQIRNYELTPVLHPDVRWWEDIAIPKRYLNFITANGWLTVSNLVCEDLARQDPVLQLLRGVGPTLVVALLLDGPQLKGRWPAQYAGVLADDPGCSVLTVTPLGMALRSRPPGEKPSRVVGYWKDGQLGARQLELAEDAEALVLTISADDCVEEWTADGRTDAGTSTQLVFGGLQQIRTKQSRGPKRQRAQHSS